YRHHHHWRHHHGAMEMSEGGTYAAPSQPIPYTQLDAYLHANHHERVSMMQGWAQPGATTGTPANTAAQQEGAPPSDQGTSANAPADNTPAPEETAPSAAPDNGAMQNGTEAAPSASPAPSTEGAPPATEPAPATPPQSSPPSDQPQ
ncbi:MAG: hypothetical protein ACRED8_08755, partial [Caulobacteraceae bacterium]